MKDKRSQLLNNFLIWVIIPIFLFTAWLTLSGTYLINYIVYKDYSFSVLSHNHNHQKIDTNKHQRIKGEFTAVDNYLGVIQVHFDTKNTTINNKINFRIREKGNQKWYYTLTTNTIHLRYLPIFPFGFPVIENSRGKTYEYEVEIMKKSQYTSLALSTNKPQLISKYQYPKDLLLKDKPVLFSFVLNKLLYVFMNSYFAVISIIYFLPFLIYMLAILSPKHIVDKMIPPNLRNLFKKYLPFSTQHPNYAILLFLLLLSDIFFIPMRIDLIVIIFMGIWFYFIKKYKIHPEASFFIATFFFLLSAFLFTFFLPKISEKAAMWAFFFLVAGTTHYIVSIFQQKKISKL